MSTTAQLRDRNGSDIPIVKASFQSNVVDFISTTEVTIEFKNSSPSEMMEVVYTQPMDPQASLFKMVVKIGDRVIEANAREKEAAKKAYDDAKDAGHGAYLASISDDEPDVYSLSLGNVPPGETVVVMISYVTEVLLDDNRVDGSVLRFSIPLGLFQRYSPRHAPSTSRFGSHRSDPTALGSAAEIPMDIQVAIQMPCDITSVSSPSSVPVKVTLGKDSRRTASVTAHPSSRDGDFVLLIERSDPFKSSLWLPNLAGTSATTMGGCSEIPSMLSINPNLPRAPQNEQLSEIVFIVDRSGSMSGQYMQTARTTLGACIASLPVGCRFQVIGFGSEFTPLFPDQLVTFDDRTKRIAMDHADTMEADMGGTEILEPIRHVAAIRKGDLPRNVLIITDGGVSNTEEVIRLVRDEYVSTGSRFFMFGIGSGASRGLVEGCAREGGGAAEMIDDSDARSGKVEEKVLRQLGRVLSPALTAVKLHWNLVDDASTSTSSSAAGPAAAVGGLSASSTADPSIASQCPQKIPAILRNTRQLVFCNLTLSTEALARINQGCSAVSGSSASAPAAGAAGAAVSTFSSASIAGGSEEAAVGIVAVAGVTPDGPYREDISEVHFMDAKTLSLCAARALIREQEALHSLHTSSSSGDGAALAEACKQRALALSLSLSTGLLCKWSSYVAVELRRGDPADSGEQHSTRTTHIYSSRDTPISRSYGGWVGARSLAMHNPVYMMAPAQVFGPGPGSWSAAPAVRSSVGSAMRRSGGPAMRSSASAAATALSAGFDRFGSAGSAEEALCRFECPRNHILQHQRGLPALYASENPSSTVYCDDCFRSNLQSELEGFYHCSQCRYDFCGTCRRSKISQDTTFDPSLPPPPMIPVLAPVTGTAAVAAAAAVPPLALRSAPIAPTITSLSRASSTTAAASTAGGSRVMALLRLQGADGHWDDSPQLRQALGGLTLPPPPECVAVSPSPTSAAGWSTLLVLLFLHKAEESQRSLWGLAAAKAARFVTRITGWSVELAAGGAEDSTAAASAAAAAHIGVGISLSSAPDEVRAAAARFLACC